MKPTFGSLFAGIGGLDLGLERSGFKCSWQVEIDDYARRVLKKHWSDVPKYRDVKEFPPIGEFEVDLICGGFPCQDISTAGKRTGIDGDRSGLWTEYHRIICDLRPRFVLVENVAALRSPAWKKEQGAAIGRVVGDLAEIGYDSEWHCIPAAAVGAPHIRDRVFLLAYPICVGQSRPWGHFKPISQKKDCYREASGLVNAFQGGAVPYVCRRHDGVSSRMERLTGLGNAVVPQVAEFIGRHIIEAMKG